MKVSFGIINHNRLFYLKSCAESLMKSVADYPDTEFICIDDNSKEPGTKEYLKSLEDRGWVVVNQQDYRDDPKNNIKQIKDVIDAFSESLNIFNNLATGELIVPLQGDTQFIRKNWLSDYVSLFKERDDVFNIMLDAQRKVRLKNCSFNKTKINNSIFAIQSGRIIGGAGDCVMRKEYVDEMGGWHVGLENNAEDIFTLMANNIFPDKKPYCPWLPVSIAIYTDPRGTNGRVRGNKRYGLYWEALKDDMYYEWLDESSLEKSENHPYSIEDVVMANGEWKLPIDENGNWKKNPIHWPNEIENVHYETI
jgi:hypothetical protein